MNKKELNKLSLAELKALQEQIMILIIQKEPIEDTIKRFI